MIGQDIVLVGANPHNYILVHQADVRTVGRDQNNLGTLQSEDAAVFRHLAVKTDQHPDPTERRMEGPFGDHTGYYSLADMYPVLHVTAITHRRKPVYPCTIVGQPPMEGDGQCRLGALNQGQAVPCGSNRPIARAGRAPPGAPAPRGFK